MYPNMSFPVPAAFFAGQPGADNGLATILLILGAFLVACALGIVFIPPERRPIILDHTHFVWGSANLDISFVELIFVGGLACIGASIYVSAPTRIVAAFNSHLEELSNKNAQLQEQLEEARRKAEGAQMVTTTLVLTAPPDVDFNNVDLKRVKCHYWLTDNREVVTGVLNGMTFQDVKCRIENIRPDAVILKINVELQASDSTKKNKILAHRDQIFPAQPNYHLCAGDKTFCPNEDSWRRP